MNTKVLNILMQVQYDVNENLKNSYLSAMQLEIGINKITCYIFVQLKTTKHIVFYTF